MKTAIFVDGAYFLKRFSDVSKHDYKDPVQVAKELYTICIRHLSDKRNVESELYRIFFYDCPPLDKKLHLPISKKCVDLSKSDTAIFKNVFFEELKKMRKTALRLGRVQDCGNWTLKPEPLKAILKGQKTFSDLTDDDFFYDFRQKQIDLKIGVDIASVTYKKQADQIILIAGDADFVPAAKLARREGIDFILDPMWKPIPNDLFEHIDGIRTPSKGIRTTFSVTDSEKKYPKAKNGKIV